MSVKKENRMLWAVGLIFSYFISDPGQKLWNLFFGIIKSNPITSMFLGISLVIIGLLTVVIVMLNKTMKVALSNNKDRKPKLDLLS